MGEGEPRFGSRGVSLSQIKFTRFQAEPHPVGRRKKIRARTWHCHRARAACGKNRCVILRESVCRGGQKYYTNIWVVMLIGVFRSASLGMGKAPGRRHSRRILRESFPERAFSCICVIVLMRVFALQKTRLAAHRAATISPERAIIAHRNFFVLSNLRTVFKDFCIGAEMRESKKT